MKFRYFIFLLICTTSLFAAVRPAMLSFNAGELSPLMRLRSDFSKYDSGCVTFQNMIPLSQGPAFRRPGLKYIATSPGPYPELICDYTSPTISSEEADTALSGDTDITTRAGFAAITGSGHYELINDLDLTGSWTPIVDFNGVLEGNGHTLSNLTIDAASSDNQGLFASFLSDCEIRNLVLKDFSITADQYVGGLVGYIASVGGITIKNVRIEDSTVDGQGGCSGGIVGYADDVYDFQIIRCTAVDVNVIDVTGWSGGIIGYCEHDGSSTGNIKILNCQTSGIVNSGSCYSGGIAGWIKGKSATSRAEIHSCNSSCTVVATGSTSDPAFGGLIGYATRVDVSDCYATGNVEDENEDAGHRLLGGFVGDIENDCNFVNCYATGGLSFSGGAIEIGGFAGGGNADGVEIIHCYSTGNVNIYNTSVGCDSIGGFIGSFGSGNSGDYGLIQQCWSLGDIWIEDGSSLYACSIGGFIGDNGAAHLYPPDILDCYTHASIAVDDDAVAGYIGGFVGYFNATTDDWDFDNCYAQGVLPSDATITGQLGGFLAKDNSGTKDVNDTNCFWDTEVSGVTDNDSNAVGKDTDAMQTEATFTNWDFTDVWLTPDTEKKLFSFEYSENDVYIQEYGHKYMRVFRTVDGEAGQVVDSTTGFPVQVRTPFEGSDLFDIQLVQLADTMFLTCPNHPPQKLTRSSHTDWTMEDMDIRTGPFMDENVTTTTITPSSVSGVVVLTASEALWTADHEGSLWRIGHRKASTTVTGTLTADGSSSIIEIYGEYLYNLQGTWEGTVTLEKSYDDGTNWVTEVPRYNKSKSIKEDYAETEEEYDVLYRVTMSGWVSGSAIYNIVVYDRTQYGNVKITDFISTTVVKAEVFSRLGGTGATTKWSEGYWSDNNGWPRTIEFHEFRMFFGGNEAYPQTIWASRTDDYNDLTIGMLDTHALIYTLPSQNSMQWMLSKEYLFMGTLGGVGRLGEKDEAMTPTTQPIYREQSPFGGKYIEAIMAGNSILYIERTGRKVREVVYNLETDGFEAPDLTILAEHITGDGIVDWAFQKRPDPTLWYIRDDGHFLSMTYNRLEHDVVGWGDHVTDGNALSVAVIPSDNEDEVWFIMEREIDSNDVLYIEQMQPRDWGSDQEDCFYVDCGLTYDSTEATSFSGWDHLEGETVSFLADGLVVDNNSISDGGFGLDTAASTVHAGLPYTSILETMPVVFTSQEGSTAAQTKNVAELAMNFYESLGTQFGIEGDTTPAFFDADITLQSDWVKRSFQHGFEDEITIYIEQTAPLPLCLRSLIPKISVTER